MLILRIRQAQVALADDRLDEAFELMRSPQMRTHRRGQEVIGKLVRALVERGQTHLANERYLAALGDCEKAQQLGGNLPEIIELRRNASDAMLDRQKSERRSAQVIAAARAHIDQGELSRGAKLLAGVNQESRAVFLMNDLEAKRERLERAPELREKLESHIETGRLDLAELAARELTAIDAQSIESQQLFRTIDECRRAWRMINAGELHQAQELMQRLASAHPKAKWMLDTSRQLSDVARMMGEIRAGALGMLHKSTASDDTIAFPPPEKQENGDSHHFLSPCQSSSPSEKNGGRHHFLPAKFVLRVDGAGSYLVVRAPSVTLGPVSSSRVPDVGLIAEPGLPVATVDRVEDDYFVRGSIGVNEKLVQGKLLASGDRIALSPRCTMHFVLPHVASTSAVIDLSGARYPKSEIRRVILLDRDLVIGPGANTHVRVDHLTAPIILRLRHDRLTTDRGDVPIGQTVQIGNVSMVISNA